MRVVIHTQYYPPEIGAPQTRLSELAKAIKAAGHEVVVLTAMPSYPVGKVYPGYGGLFRRETLDGIPVLRTWAYPNQSPSLIKRLANYFSFTFSSLIAGIFVLRRPDYVLTESPPVFLGLAGWLLSRIKGARWVFNVSDLWTETALRIGALKNDWKLRAAAALERFCYRKAWLVTGQSQEILAGVRREAPGAAVYHLSNGVNTSVFSPQRRSAAAQQMLKSSQRCVVLYSGLHGLAQGLMQVLDAAALLRQDPSIGFVFVGDGPDKRRLVERARLMGLDNVEFLDPVPSAHMPAIVSSAGIGVVPLKVELPGAVPSKLYEYMGSGLPVILVAAGEPARIVESTSCGVVVSPDSPQELADAIRRLARDPDLRAQMGAAGRRAAEQSYDRVSISQRFAAHLESCMMQCNTGFQPATR